MTRRIWAYIIDLIFITVVLNMLNNIYFLNPKYDEYLETVDKYYEVMENSLEKEPQEAIEEITNITYDLNYYGLSFSITKIVVYIAYFVFFQYFNKGQTLGKKLMNIKLLNADDTKISFLKIFLREMILFGLYADLFNIILLFIVPKTFYFFSYFLLSSLASNILLITILLITLKKDHLGLHDIITKTKVVRA